MSNSDSNPYFFFGCWISAVAVFVGLLAYMYFKISGVASYGLGISIAALILMGLDKSLATSGSMRVPEKIFFALAALGGGMGILLGMHVFRHKTKKATFQGVLVLIVMVQIFAATRLGLEFRNPSAHESVR